MEFSLASMLPIAWYVILVVAVFAYSLGDGFDLGLSTIYYISRADEERRVLLNSIGPIWDGNEVWLIIIFGGLFAGFPPAYGALLSIFYMPIWTLVLLYIFRGCSLEFRSKTESAKWKSFWDVTFCISGIAISFFLGVIVGNMVLGLPLSPTTPYSSLSWVLFFRPYTLLCGALVVCAFAIHGITFVSMKTTGELQQRIVKHFPYVLSAFLVVYLLLISATLAMIPQIHGNSFQVGHFSGVPTYPLLTLLLAMTLGCCFATKTCLSRERYGCAFLYSSLNLLLLILSSVTLVFPNILFSTVDPENSYTIYNAAASTKTLQSLLVIVLVGLPFIVAYGVYIYRVFRGKTDFPSVY
ncbi:cytochrome D ubiquinol oxidase, subunit II [Chlamydia abortus]|uniref:Cytochrome D ubiquinol oxidase, subunit II n=1 Tax=Chlamydia abortus (strain DSM 27085 / S26/3) TaxID=218497 RepID=Q5L5K4_CHLAB|nr:cytochrome d ubiquinol oxidase subunit II [Chlamydia abortus]ASD30765.1 cytochrome d ubiquinol oxidase subunit II [Chlamydia abortus]AUS60117.1 cytochrome d ubiquinol oxidase subunit II [Chlamydia abortus]CAH64087.1 putative cytochrome D ubiquinol oxidase, subunit II [Chlamydia abortus S26/3]SFW01683.1 cytochrome D ubiquinol oxidase, subunit II [Chlamydia abortus]SFW03021.1 cytochrome D ubiquinol oxidase, subunit II [Chlamydia abortus]